MDAMPSDAYPQLNEKITNAVHKHFQYELKRPELMNRIGQNIVVFDFLRYESVVKIFEAVLKRVIATVAAEHGLHVTLRPPAYETLRTLCTHDVFNGGRGVGNRIETHFVNPLARALFDSGLESDVIVENITSANGHTQLCLAKNRPHRSDPAGALSRRRRGADRGRDAAEGRHHRILRYRQGLSPRLRNSSASPSASSSSS